MITSAKEFLKLRTSDLKEEYDRAAHGHAPLEVWQAIVRDYPDMKVWVVHNKTIPLEILEELSIDEDAAVREAVAMKRKASLAILERLAHDVDSSVRYAVACNQTTPSEILTGLLNDPWDLIAARAKARLRSANP